VGCINAIGQAMLPLYEAKNLNMEWMKEEVPGTTYGLSDNGWIDMELLSSGSIVTSWGKSTLTTFA